MARELARRALRCGDRPTVEACLGGLRVRASTRLLSHATLRWPGALEPVVSLLCAHGARVNGHPGLRPLHASVVYGKAGAARTLLAARASPNLWMHGETALHIAVRYGRESMVKLLIDHGGARAGIPDVLGDTPLGLARTVRVRHAKKCHDKGCRRGKARLRILRMLREHARSDPSVIQQRRFQGSPMPEPEDMRAPSEVSSISDGELSMGSDWSMGMALDDDIDDDIDLHV